ncbi:MAG: prepilin-type N-terminal cleavage/methylation domain-containing protein [Deltaproteobacteria bacterium]|nr:prepilin-type N-terminal cleavage/methylation domain-containing protein [Deltaproteobacteria bacterium]
MKALDFLIRTLKLYTLNLKPVINRGFTLLEILIAIFMLALVVTAVFGAFSGTFKVVTETEVQEDIYATARVALERISEDLASVCGGGLSKGEQPQTGVTRQQFLFVGEDHRVDDKNADTLRFLSSAHLSFKIGRREEGPAEISYYTEYREETDDLALYRSDTLDYLEGGEDGQGGLLLCEGLKWLDFIYYDRDGDAHNTWDTTQSSGMAQLPSRVEISVGFENALDPENPLQFMTGVALPPIL